MRISRRRFIRQATTLVAGIIAMPNVFGAGVAASQFVRSGNAWFMPDESETHKRTWMAFGASEKIWGRKLLPEVRKNLVNIANTISRYEPVTMLVRPKEAALAKKLLDTNVEVLMSDLNDLWMRDTGPVFVVNGNGKKAAINFHFNGWGNKQEHDQDAKIANVVAQEAGINLQDSQLVLEGGGIEVDGQGTAIITESCVLNKNRNPQKSKVQIETALKSLLGLTKIIWLPGIRGQDITDGHTDFYARFARPGVVVAGYDPDPNSFDHAVTKKHLSVLKNAKDAQGRVLEIVVIEAPAGVRKKFSSKDFAAGYINFYVCNDAVIAPQFGHKASDDAAKEKLQELFLDREIVQLNVDGIAAGGGGIHCTTQQEPL